MRSYIDTTIEPLPLYVNHRNEMSFDMDLRLPESYLLDGSYWSRDFVLPHRDQSRPPH